MSKKVAAAIKYRERVLAELLAACPEEWSEEYRVENIETIRAQINALRSRG